MNRRAPFSTLLAAASLGTLVLVGCGGTRERHHGNGNGDPHDGGTTQPLGDASAPAAATLTGTVYAPEGTIPISGALVYITSYTPDPIPDHVYCDQCVELPSGTPFTTTAADGSFSLDVPSTGSVKLVVQKGAFRRVRSLTIAEGVQSVDKTLTTLPKKMDKANGDDIPKMAVIVGAWDHVEQSLARLGLGTITHSGFLGQADVDRTTASFDFYENTGLQPGPKSPDKILKNWDVISQYHVVFIPCQGSNGTTCNDYRSLDKPTQDNLRKFVNAGGKLYVTDYAYDFVRQPFPGYVDWAGQGAQNAVGSACMPGEYDADAQVQDSGLKDWLAAQGINAFKLLANWTTVSRVNTVGMVTPKVWVQSAQGLNTVSFVYGCGRVLFSTYHTEGDQDGGGLLPQERALLYVLLEVSVCVTDPIIQ